MRLFAAPEFPLLPTPLALQLLLVFFSSVTCDLQPNHNGLNLRCGDAPAVIFKPLYGGYVARPTALIVLSLLYAATGRNDGTANIAVVCHDAVCGGGVPPVAADAGAAAAVVVLLEAGLQLRHLGHGVRAAGPRNALRGKLQR